jgi:hypothetical protein
MSSLHRRSESGVALVAVMMILAMLMGLAVALNTSTNMDTALRGAYHRTTTGFYAAESGLNRGMGDYRNIFLNFNVPTGSDFAAHSISIGSRNVNYQISDVTAYVSGNPPSITIPPGQLFGGLNSQEYDYIANSTATSGSDVEARVNAEFKVGYIPLFQFVAFYTRDLEILPGPQMILNGRVHTNGSLYLNGGTSLQIADNFAAGINTVQVSAAGDIYRGRKNDGTCDNGNSDTRVTVDMLQDIVAPMPNDLDPKNLPCSGASKRLIPSSELALWKGSMVNKVQSIAIPPPEIVARGSGNYWTKADLRIVLNLTKNTTLAGAPAALKEIEVQNADGTANASLTTQLHNFMLDRNFNFNSGSWKGTMPLFYTDVPTACGCTDATPGCNPAGTACYTPNFGTVQATTNDRVYNSNMTNDGTKPGFGGKNFDADHRRGGFYNWREKKWMMLLNINMADLILWNHNNGTPFFADADATDGGLVIFASVQGPSSLLLPNNYGVRIFGSWNLPILPGGIGVVANPTGMTFATDQAVYVLGNYNSVTEQPSAVMGDSVNVLSSNYWKDNTIVTAPNCGANAASCTAATLRCNDYQSVCGLDQAARNGTATVINTAFLGGVDDTDGTNNIYNGGLENYPRFQENWGGALTYQGSFVSLGIPGHVNGQWCGTGGSLGSGCNIYNPPNRVWNYDPAFNNAANLPPLSPRFVYVQQVLFTEEFK